MSVVGQPFGYQVGGRLRHQCLATVAEVSDPGGTVDRRADVVALVSELDLAGVDPDPQANGGKVNQLQVEGTGDSVRRPAERHHEAVAFALLDGTNPAVASDDLPRHIVQAGDRRGHGL